MISAFALLLTDNWSRITDYRSPGTFGLGFGLVISFFSILDSAFCIHHSSFLEIIHHSALP
jgi:hypothetical protein